jgi:tetratricopeptide (TPR) repeat protein
MRRHDITADPFRTLRDTVAGRASRDDGRAAVYRMLSRGDRATGAPLSRIRDELADDDYTGAIEGALDALPELLLARDVERAEASRQAEQLAEIARVSPADARQRAAAISNTRLDAVLRELVERADALAVAEPALGIALAGVALAAAEAGRPDESDAPRCDLRAAARRCLAEAAFRGGDLVAAEGTLREAMRLARHGSGDSVLRAQLLRVAAEIRSDQSRFTEARRLAARAVRLLERAGESRLEGRARVTLAMKHFLAGDPHEALNENARARSLVDGERDARWWLAVEFNHAFWSFEVGDLETARQALPRLGRLADDRGSAHDRVCLAWLAARIAAREGDLARAEELYRPVLARCLELDTIYDSATVALELAVVLLELGRAEEVLPLADMVAPIFRAQGVEPEAAAAVLLAAESLRQGVAVREVLRSLIAARAAARGAR